MQNKMDFIFFGSSEISVITLEKLKEKGFLPKLIVTKPDRPKGRGLEMTESPVKTWAKENNIPFEAPEKIRDENFVQKLKDQNPEVGILVSYGKIIPQNILDLFPKGILNLHPSLLPLLRGPAPIEYTILNDLKEKTGVSIMLLDSKMDEGPILVQKKVSIDSWPPSKTELYEKLSNVGGELLAEILPDYLSGKISATEQDPSLATYCQIIKKSDGEISLLDDPYKNFLKFKAYTGWPGVFYFEEKVRIKITDAEFVNNEFKILKVIPEGKKEIGFEDFKKNQN